MGKDEKVCFSEVTGLCGTSMGQGNASLSKWCGYMTQIVSMYNKNLLQNQMIRNIETWYSVSGSQSCHCLIYLFHWLGAYRTNALYSGHIFVRFNDLEDVFT